MVQRRIDKIRRVPEGMRVVLRVSGATADGSERFETITVPAGDDDDLREAIAGQVDSTDSARSLIGRLVETKPGIEDRLRRARRRWMELKGQREDAQAFGLPAPLIVKLTTRENRAQVRYEQLLRRWGQA